VAPLEGKLVVLLRAAGQGGTLAQELEALGASLLHVPVIAIAPPEDPGPLRAAIGRLDAFDWIVFTSPNAVSAFAEEAGDRELTARIASVGPGTSERAREAGLTVAIEAKESLQEGLARELVAQGVRGKEVLIPRSAIARDVLERALEEAGSRVTAVAAYRTIEGEGDLEPLRRALAEGRVDAICFTSASTARHLARRIGVAELVRCLESGRPVAASMGPIASSALRELGIERVAEAREHTARGLARAVREALEGS